MSRQESDSPDDWLLELQALLGRVSGYGLTPDLAGLTIVQLKGVLAFLKRVTETG